MPLEPVDLAFVLHPDHCLPTRDIGIPQCRRLPAYHVRRLTWSRVQDPGVAAAGHCLHIHRRELHHRRRLPACRRSHRRRSDRPFEGYRSAGPRSESRPRPCSFEDQMWVKSWLVSVIAQQAQRRSLIFNCLPGMPRSACVCVTRTRESRSLNHIMLTSSLHLHGVGGDWCAVRSHAGRDALHEGNGTDVSVVLKERWCR